MYIHICMYMYIIYLNIQKGYLYYDIVAFSIMNPPFYGISIYGNPPFYGKFTFRARSLLCGAPGWRHIIHHMCNIYNIHASMYISSIYIHIYVYLYA